MLLSQVCCCAIGRSRNLYYVAFNSAWSSTSNGVLVLRPGIGRTIPSLFILYISVVRFSPNLTAAPSGPPIIQPAASNACKINARPTSFRVVEFETTVTVS
jgi:hypothetical protein